MNLVIENQIIIIRSAKIKTHLFFNLKSFIEKFFKKLEKSKYYEALNIENLSNDIFRKILICRNDDKWKAHLMKITVLPYEKFKKKYEIIKMWTNVRKFEYALSVKKYIQQQKKAAMKYISSTFRTLYYNEPTEQEQQNYFYKTFSNKIMEFFDKNIKGMYGRYKFCGIFVILI